MPKYTPYTLKYENICKKCALTNDLVNLIQLVNDSLQVINHYVSHVFIPKNICILFAFLLSHKQYYNSINI